MKKLILFTLVLAGLLTLSLILYSRTPAKHLEVKTRFYYPPDVLAKLHSYSTASRMSERELTELDTFMFSVVKKKKLPPTEASRFYASVLTAQKEAADLSYSIKGEYQGSLKPVTYEMVCMMYLDSCADMNKALNGDAYSLEISRLVTAQYKLRNIQDKQITQKPKTLTGEQYWKGKPVTPDAGSWMLWNIQDKSKYMAPTPPVYGEEEDLKQVAAVKEAVTHITPQQKKAVLYWAGGAGTETPAGIWLGIMNDYVRKNNKMTFAEILNLRTTMSTTMADAFIVCWYNKFTYWTSRPNMRDTSIVTIIKTPPFPSYISGHSTVSAAAATVLSHYFPENKDKWMQMAEEAKNSRLWAGIHFPSDNNEGFNIGKKLASDILASR